MRIALGATRTVIVTQRWAFKLPGRWVGVHEGRWRSFLNGLLANMQEAQFAPLSDSLCPVVFALPGGFLTVMRAVERTLTHDELLALEAGDLPGFQLDQQLRDVDVLVDAEGLTLPGELKVTSFGWMDGRVVMVDFGDCANI